MTSNGESNAAEPSTEALRRLADACGSLESQWRAEVRPMFEELVATFPPEERELALRELLKVDLELRRRIGQTPLIADYEAMASKYAETIYQMFAEPHQMGFTPEIPGHELLERLGAGGMGMVFRARHVATGRIVAVKLVRGDLADRLSAVNREELSRRFDDEAKAIAALDHPGIVPLYEVGETAGWRYFTMRYMEGGSLAELAKTGLAAESAAALIADVARAVQHAHDVGILHRDLKPANILLDAAGRPRIGDFGLAKRAASTEGFSRSMPGIGTPGYMPPEQSLGAELTVRSDVYGLGATLYALLTGSPPPPVDATVNLGDEMKSTPAPLRAVCLQCLRKNPNERYASAAEVADDLDRFLAGQSVRALPEGWRGSVRRFISRRTTKVGIGVITILLLAITGIWVVRIRPQQIEAAARLRVDAALKQLSSGKSIAGLFALEEASRQIPSWTPDLLETAEANLASWAAVVPRVEFLADAPAQASKFAVSRDGNRFAVGTATGDLFLYDRVAQGTIPISRSHQGNVSAIAWSSDGKSLASSGADGRLRIWNVETTPPSPLRDVPLDKPASALAFVNNDSMLFVGSRGGKYLGLSIWNRDGSLANNLGGELVLSLRTDANGDRALVIRNKDVAELWSAATPRLIATLPNETKAACFVRNGTTVATSGTRFRLFSSKDGAPAPFALYDDADAKTVLFVGSVGRSGLLWHDASGDTFLSYDAPPSLERLLMPREFNFRLAASEGDCLWAIDPQSVMALRIPEPIQRLTAPDELRLSRLEATPSHLAAWAVQTSKKPSSVAVWDSTDLAKVPRFPPFPPETDMASALASGGRALLVASQGRSKKRIQSLDPQTFAEHFSFEVPFVVITTAVLPSGEIAVTGDGNRLRILGTSGELKSEVDLGFRATRLAVHPDGKWIAAVDKASNLAAVRVTPTLKEAWRRVGPSVTRGVAFSPDGNAVIALSATGAAMAVRTSDGTPVDAVDGLPDSEQFKISTTAALSASFQRALLVGRAGAQLWSTADNLPIGPPLRLESIYDAVFLDRRRAALLSRNEILISRTTPLPPAADRRRWLQSISAANETTPMTVSEWRELGSSPSD
jgi:hypothetical protein